MHTITEWGRRNWRTGWLTDRRTNGQEDERRQESPKFSVQIKSSRWTYTCMPEHLCLSVCFCLFLCLCLSTVHVSLSHSRHASVSVFVSIPVSSLSFQFCYRVEPVGLYIGVYAELGTMFLSLPNSLSLLALFRAIFSFIWRRDIFKRVRGGTLLLNRRNKISRTSS